MKAKIKTWYYQIDQYIHKEYDSVLLLMGLMMLCYLSMNLVRAQYVYKNASTPKYRFSMEYVMDGIWAGEMLDEVSAWFEGRGDNCSIRGLGGKAGNSLDGGEMVIYLSAEAIAQKEKLDLAQWNEKKNALLIEGQLKNMTYKKNGETCILINDMEFVVYDVINEMELLGRSCYVNWKNLDEEHRRMVLKSLEDRYIDGVESSQTIQVERLTRFEGEQEEFAERYQEHMHTRLNYEGPFDFARKYLAIKLNAFYLGMLILGLSSLYYIVVLWIQRRKREFLIRRILGFGYFRLVGTAIREAGTVTLLAFGGALLAELVKIGYGTLKSLLWHQLIPALIYSLLITLAMEILLVGSQILFILRICPTQGNIESAGE